LDGEFRGVLLLVAHRVVGMGEGRRRREKEHKEPAGRMIEALEAIVFLCGEVLKRRMIQVTDMRQTEASHLCFQERTLGRNKIMVRGGKGNMSGNRHRSVRRLLFRPHIKSALRIDSPLDSLPEEAFDGAYRQRCSIAYFVNVLF